MTWVELSIPNPPGENRLNPHLPTCASFSPSASEPPANCWFSPILIQSCLEKARRSGWRNLCKEVCR